MRSGTSRAGSPRWSAGSVDLLRTRAARREEPLDTYVPDPLVSPLERIDPEQEVLLADSVGLALLVVLETLEPAERLAFVLHDMFAVPFDDIAPVVGRSSAATRQLASRARRRVRGAAAPEPELDPARQKLVLDAFLAASRAGDFEALVSVLHPDVVLRVDSGVLVGGAAASKVIHGATGVAQQALMFRRFSKYPARAGQRGGRCGQRPPKGAPCPSWASPSPTAASSRCTSSPTPPACSTWPSPTWRADPGPHTPDGLKRCAPALVEGRGELCAQPPPARSQRTHPGVWSAPPGMGRVGAAGAENPSRRAPVGSVRW